MVDVAGAIVGKLRSRRCNYPSPKSDGHPLASIALFSRIGLLVSLVAARMGVQGAWY
jgi:hypothetical protein